jgi:hypothetical protein
MIYSWGKEALVATGIHNSPLSELSSRGNLTYATLTKVLEMKCFLHHDMEEMLVGTYQIIPLAL